MERSFQGITLTPAFTVEYLKSLHLPLSGPSDGILTVIDT